MWKVYEGRDQEIATISHGHLRPPVHLPSPAEIATSYRWHPTISHPTETSVALQGIIGSPSSPITSRDLDDAHSDRRTPVYLPPPVEIAMGSRRFISLPPISHYHWRSRRLPMASRAHRPSPITRDIATSSHGHTHLPVPAKMATALHGTISLQSISHRQGSSRRTPTITYDIPSISHHQRRLRQALAGTRPSPITRRDRDNLPRHHRPSIHLPSPADIATVDRHRIGTDYHCPPLP